MRSDWGGPFYELGIELAERSVASLAKAAEALWRFEDLDGPYWPSYVAAPWTPVNIREELDKGTGVHFWGFATLPDGQRVGCGSTALHAVGREEPTHLLFYIPLGELEEVYAVTPEPDPSWASWAAPLEEWLASLGKAVYEEAPYALGVIGLEPVVSTVDAMELRRDGIPDTRGAGLLWPDAAVMRWYPTTRWG